jgi:sugar phosphate isomerase/epimerase
MAPMREDWTRREWLQRTAAGTMAAAVGSLRTAAAGTRVLGVQLYTVRDQMKPDQAAATLRAIADIGYKEVEVLHQGMAETTRLAKEVGLAPVSMHIEAPLVTGDWSAWASPGSKPAGTLDQLIDEAKPLGYKYLVVSYLMPGERNKPGFFPAFADSMNKAGEKVKKAGMQLCYHNHGFEFEPQADGKRPLDLLFASFDKANVKFELDVFWVGITGADPVALLNEHAGRVALVHLKDKAKDAPKETNEAKVPPATFKEVGNGSLDFAAILKAATSAGVEHFFVEQDHTPGNPIASLKQSYTYLQSLA